MILVNEANLQEWEGAETPLDGRTVKAKFRWDDQPNAPATDYDRACDVTEPLGVIAAATGQALVLGDEPNAMTWLPESLTVGTMVRRVYVPEDIHEETIIALLSCAPNDVFVEETFNFVIPGSALYLFDSAYSGKDVSNGQVFGGVIVITLTPGEYRIESAQYKPDTETCFYLHRLTLKND